MRAEPLRILAVDTATESCSAACLVGAEMHQRSALDPQGHSQLLLGMIEEESLPHKPIPLMACCGLFVDSVGFKGVLVMSQLHSSSQAGEI